MKITTNKTLLKFLIILFSLWMFPFPLQYIPVLSKLAEWWNEMFQYIVLFVGNNILSLEPELTITRSGSGDKMFDFVQLLTITSIAFLGTIIWTIVQNNKGDYKKLNYWFWVYLRYNLFAIMLSYGLAKTFPLQFPEPSFSRLITEFGELSPMGLAWSFMGYSKGYVIFSGLMEVIGGILLLHKRTVFLGAMILIAVTVNIVALNFLYDIPVKLYSIRYLLMAFLIASPQLRKVISLFLTNKSIKPFQFYNPFKAKKRKLIKDISKWSLLIIFVSWRTNAVYKQMYSYGPLAEKPALYGLYEVDEFKLNDGIRPPLMTDSLRWRYLISEFEGRLKVYNMKKKPIFLKTKVDTVNREIKMNGNIESERNSFNFRYVLTDSTLVLKGYFNLDTIELKSKRFTKKDFPLMNRKFNWIQEYPYNR